MSGSMLGLIGSGPTGDVEAQARRAELVPSGVGEVLGGAVAEAFSESPGVRYARVARRGYFDRGDGTYQATNAIDDLTGLPTGELPPSPMVPVDVLKRDYSIPGVLDFDKDTPQSVAQSLYEHKVAQLKQADAVARATNIVTQGGVARFLASAIGSFGDPVNVAAMFVPGLNEVAASRVLGVAGATALERAAIRGVVGGTQGAAGMAALEPLNYALSKQERDDWTMVGALANVALGTVMGAGLHSGLGALAERTRGLPAGDTARVASERIQAAPPEVQEAMMRHAVAAQADGRPVQAADLLDLYDALSREEAALRGEAAGVADVPPDPVTQERLAAIEAEMQGAIPAARRADLEAERTMLEAPLPDDVAALERARSEAQRAGLTEAADRIARRLDEVTQQLDEATRPTVAQAVDSLTPKPPNPDAPAAQPPHQPQVDAPPPEPRPRGEPTAVQKEIAELDRSTAAWDRMLAARDAQAGGESAALANRVAEFDRLSNEAVEADTATFQSAINCLMKGAT